jgi:hypothetical protein
VNNALDYTDYATDELTRAVYPNTQPLSKVFLLGTAAIPAFRLA